MRAISPPLPSVDDTASRAVLRDGSVVRLRLAEPSDHAVMARFFHEMSPESRRMRFFGAAEPSDEILDRFCDSSDLTRSATLLALRLADGELRPIAVGSYFSTGASTAEVAFAVDDHFHGKGLGTDAPRERGDARGVPRVGIRDSIEVRARLRERPALDRPHRCLGTCPATCSSASHR